MLSKYHLLASLMSIAEFLPKAGPRTRPVFPNIFPTRNQKCICGSGKKAKRCCTVNITHISASNEGVQVVVKFNRDCGNGVLDCETTPRWRNVVKRLEDELAEVTEECEFVEARAKGQEVQFSWKLPEIDLDEGPVDEGPVDEGPVDEGPVDFEELDDE